MGIREHQYIGLTEEAKLWLEEHVKKIPCVVCPKCGEVIAEKMSSKKCGTGLGMFEEDEFNLLEYDLKSETGTIKEVIQCQPWRSGPMTFLCLELGGINIFQWSEEEISKY